MTATHPTVYFPGTTIPVPPLLTEEEVIRLCRWDVTSKNPSRTVEMHRDAGRLRAKKRRKGCVYLLTDVLDFLRLEAGHEDSDS